MGGYAQAVLNQLTSDQLGPLKIRSLTVTLTSAQLKSMFATQIPLLPAPGLGKAYNLIFAFAHYRAGTTPYTLGAGSELQLQAATANSDGQTGLAVSAGFLDQATDQIVLGGFSGLPVPAASFSNVPFYITEKSAAAMTLGDGTLTITLYYTIVDLTVEH
jgi:hypothetical protein